jgi:hypothetical protein
MTVKELKTNNMGYTPYKMLGHELPGIKQRAPGKMSMEKTHINDKMVDGVSKKSGVLYKEGGGVGSSPAKGWLSNMAKKVGGFAKKAMDPLGLKGKAKKALGMGGDDSAGGGDTAGLEARVTELEGQVEAANSGGGGDTLTGKQAANAMFGVAGGGGGGSAFGPKDPKKLAAMAAVNSGVSGLGGTGLGGISAPFEGWKGV